ncbi:MAG: hypothetical protein IV100_34165 [Myxococcales bacterium]|nr:hypothetical protein [Myxococcales bacterium]
MRTAFLSLALGLVALGPGCTAIFPDRDATESTTTPGTDGTIDPGPVGTAGFGQTCTSVAVHGFDNCIEPESCAQISLIGATMCTHTCNKDTDCAADGRCTETPDGRVCVPRCVSDPECTVRSTAFRCIPVSEGVGVCWTNDATSGEVKAVAAPTIDRLEFNRCDAGGGCVPGLPAPGATVQMSITVKNAGIRQLNQLNVTVIPGSGNITDFTGATGAIPLLDGNASGIPAANPRFTIRPEVAPGTVIGFTLRLVTATESWESKFNVTAFGTAASLYVNPPSLMVAGTPVTTASPGQEVAIRLDAVNVGFGDAPNVVVTVSAPVESPLTLINANPITILEPAKVGGVPFPNQVYQGNLLVSAAATGPVPLTVKLTDATGASWNQVVDVPVTPP